MIIDSRSKSLCNPGNPILEDVVIHDSDDEPVLVAADLGRRPCAIEFVRGQSFYDRAYLRDVLKEFAILNTFELQHIKTDSARVTALFQ